MTDLFKNKENCCGCTACKNICPHGAIEMLPDEDGFLYPHIKNEKCSKCGLCVKTCPMTKAATGEKAKPVPYALKHSSDDVRMNSSSGGAFTAIAETVFSDNSKVSVYGAQYDEKFRVCHGKASSLNEIDKFRGSKYAQSDMGNCYSQVKEDLKNGKSVLFTGTPCQCAGLYNFLQGKNIENLTVCDVICHGTPSPMVFEDHKKMLEGKYKSEIIKIDFRYKPWEWKSQSLMVQFANNKKYINTKEYDSYYKLFLPNIILRPSCYSCPFTNLQRHSDLTIADFWGIEKSMPEFEDTKGVSLLLVNTEKGAKLFSSMKDRIIYKEICLDDCMQTNLMHPSLPSPKRDAFWMDYHKLGYDYVVKHYAKTNIINHTAKKALKKIGLFDYAKSILKK